MRDTTDESKACTRSPHPTLSEAIMAHLPPGSRALTPCATTMDPTTHELRCAHKHAGKHLRTSPGASVTLLPSGLAHIVEPCGGHSEKHSCADTACDGDDPYVLWYVMAMPAPPPGTPPGVGCPNAAPYTPTALDPATTPNPNNPASIHPLVTRHWSTGGAPVTHIISMPPTMTAGMDIFGGALPTGATYTWATFTTEIETLMNGVSALPTANTPPVMRLTSYPAGMVTPDYYAFVGSIIAGSGQFIWAWTGPAGGCGGPTGNGVNEFTFVAATLGGVTGGLTSMLVDPGTGVISECDVIFEVGLGSPSQWTGRTNQAHTGLAHEVGHFWGLDHTNLHAGGLATLIPPASIGIAYASSYDLPAMVASHTNSATITTTPTSNRVNDPWRPDDLAAFSAIYPVNTIVGSKLPMINTTAVITGKVIDGATGNAGVFGMNAYVVRAPVPGTIPLTPSQTAPAVGTITGTARPDIYAITGVFDTSTGARCTGDFRIDGIPAIWGGYYAYNLYLESPAASNFSTMFLGEWWFEAFLNASVNIPTPTTIPVIYTGTGQTPALVLSSLAVSAGTTIQLERPIDIRNSATNPFQIDNVSRPLIHVSPRTSRPGPGTLISITVWHNRTACTSINPIIGPPLQSITCTWNGQKLPVTLVSTNFALPLLSTTVPVITQYTATIPAGTISPVVVEVTALEVPGAPGSAPSVVGRNMVIY